MKKIPTCFHRDACGFPRVTFLRTTTLHGGARHLWRCEGAA